MKTELLRFRDPLMMPGGYTFDYVGTLKMIDLYLNSKFQTGDKDNRGFRKFFYNIVKPACDIATKFIDLDTKDIMLFAEQSDQEEKVWLMQHDLKQWLKENKFGTLLNEIGERYPEYGSVVLKKQKSKFKNVQLQNLRFDPSARILEDSDFVYEINLMTWGEMAKMPWDKATLKKIYNEQETFYEVYECYTQQPEGKKWKYEIKADCFYEKTLNNELVRTTEAKINDAT